MIIWRSLGASVIGPGHINSGISNQDAWLSVQYEWGDIITVADGVGSKKFSDFGSRCACLAVARAIYDYREDVKLDQNKIANTIKDKWLSLISPLDPRDCASTCLLAFRSNKGFVTIGILGDGLAAAVKVDGSVESLSDDKLEGFSNITIALSPNVNPHDWRWLSIPEIECQSIFLCTDGVSDDLLDTDGFVKTFFDAYRDFSSVSGARRLRKVLTEWPTPKHTDDKTIACLLREDISDE